LSSGAEAARIVSIPVREPADPIPAIALPTMKSVDVFATPHIKDPTSKIPRPPRKRNYAE